MNNVENILKQALKEGRKYGVIYHHNAAIYFDSYEWCYHQSGDDDHDFVDIYGDYSLILNLQGKSVARIYTPSINDISLIF